MDNKGQQPPAQQPMAYKQEIPASTEFQSGLFDCFSGGEDHLCLKATFCPCFTYGKTVARVKDPSLSTYQSFNEDCLFFAAANSCCGFGWVFAFLSRGDTRTRYGITGSGAGDCFKAYCCSCCSLIQVEKEVLVRQAQGNGGYVAPAGMVMPQQQQ